MNFIFNNFSFNTTSTNPKEKEKYIGLTTKPLTHFPISQIKIFKLTILRFTF